MTLPNALTLLRILAVPFFSISIWYGHHWEAFLLFAGAGLTDLLDGFIEAYLRAKASGQWQTAVGVED